MEKNRRADAELDHSHRGASHPSGADGQCCTSAGPRRRPIIFWNDIRDRAFQKWRAAGEPPGDCTRFWLEAERELLESA